MEAPLVTIGITCYREGNWLKECWDSVCAQSDNRWEAILIIDYGADQKTRAIFNRLEHPQLRKIMLDRQSGPYAARTLAIKNATTEWYIHLDADDTLPANAVALIVDTFQKFEYIDFVFGDCLHFGEGKDELKRFYDFDKDNLTDGMTITATSPIRISLYKKIGGYIYELRHGGADWGFWVGVAELDVKGAYAGGVIYNRRRRKGSVGSGWSLKRDQVAQTIIEHHPIYFSDQERRQRCLGKACEMVARNYRVLGNRIKAANYAERAIAYGTTVPTVKRNYGRKRNVHIPVSDTKNSLERYYRRKQKAEPGQKLAKEI